MRIQKIILELKQTVKEGNKSVLGVVLDYLSLRKRKWLLWNEYYNYELDRQSSEFRKNFLGAIEQGVYLELLNPFKYYILARNKYLTHLVLEKENIPMPELYCYYNPERGVTSDGNVSNDLFSTIQVLKAKNVKKCVVKETEGSHGESVFAVNGIIYEGDDALMEIVGGRTVRLSTILRQYPLLFEQRIIQTKQLSDFNPTSVNTIRFMTVLFPNGEVEIIGTFIKIGRAGSFVDNAGKGGNVDAGIDSDTGEVYGAIEFNGFRKSLSIDSHPDTGCALNGVVLDNWNFICRKLKSFQQKIPFLKAVGWDVALTDNGPVIIEINDFWDTTGQLFIKKGWRESIRKCYLAWYVQNLKDNVNYDMGRRNPAKMSLKEKVIRAV